MKDRFFRIILGCVRRFWKRPVIHGTDRIDLSRPAVFVANHLGSFGPVVLNAYLPFRLIPWVTHEVTDRKLCPEYLRRDFVESELGLKPPLSRLVSVVIGRLCVTVMEHVEAIPVYRRSRKIIITLEKSMRELEEGGRLLIFPEIQNAIDDTMLNVFNTGFLNIARALFRKDGSIVNFYPVCVRKAANTIGIGRPIAFDPANPFSREKRRIIRYLEESIRSMHEGLEDLPPGDAVRLPVTTRNHTTV